MAAYRIRLGTCNTYLIQGSNGYIMVDAGNANREKAFLHHLRKNSISPDQIKLIVVTHVHFDHVGSLGAIKNICRCPVAVHENEVGLIKKGKTVIPPGVNLLGKTVSYLGKKATENGFLKFDAVDPDIVVTKERSLEEFGVKGSIVPTPGHTAGSMSVVLSTGEAFVGDLAVNFFGCVVPPFAESFRELVASWRMIASLGAKTIFPGHGPPFCVSLLEDKKGDRVTPKSLISDRQFT